MWYLSDLMLGCGHTMKARLKNNPAEVSGLWASSSAHRRRAGVTVGLARGAGSQTQLSLLSDWMLQSFIITS